MITAKKQTITNPIILSDIYILDIPYIAKDKDAEGNDVTLIRQERVSKSQLEKQISELQERLDAINNIQ